MHCTATTCNCHILFSMPVGGQHLRRPKSVPKAAQTRASQPSIRLMGIGRGHCGGIENGMNSLQQQQGPVVRGSSVAGKTGLQQVGTACGRPFVSDSSAGEWTLC